MDSKFDGKIVEDVAGDLERKCRVIEKILNDLYNNPLFKQKNLISNNYLQLGEKFIYLKNYYTNLYKYLNHLSKFLRSNVIPNYDEFSKLIVSKFDLSFSEEITDLLGSGKKGTDVTKISPQPNKSVSQSNMSFNVSSPSNKPVYDTKSELYSTTSISQEKDDCEVLEEIDDNYENNSSLSSTNTSSSKQHDDLKSNNSKLLGAIGSVAALGGVGSLVGFGISSKFKERNLKSDDNEDSTNISFINQNNNQSDELSDDDAYIIPDNPVYIGKITPVKKAFSISKGEFVSKE